MALKLQLTKDGLEECLQARSRGLQAEITHMAFGDIAFRPGAETKALPGLKEKVEILDYQDGGKSLRMAGVFDGQLEYAIRSVGIYLSSGTLLGVYSENNALIGYRTPDVRVVQWFTLNIEALPTSSVTVVTGVENLNLILDAELAEGCAAFIAQGETLVKQAHWNMQLSERIRKLEN